MSDELKLWAVRGATKVERNDAEEIVAATEELMRELIARNGLEPQHIVSCIFTSTHDLNAEFPAVAARKIGLNHVPLLGAAEVDVPGAMPSVIRALVHYYAPADPPTPTWERRRSSARI
jgi:chorismate mutase